MKPQIESRVGPGSFTLSRSQVGSSNGALPLARFHRPPRQTQHAVFPHYAFLLTSSQGL